ncbi:MAG: SURF1 family protein [Novosphingobium sp.]
MTRRFPILATVLVLAAIGTMIGLGIWQLRRMEWKDALLDRYRAAAGAVAEVPFPRSKAASDDLLYRRSRVDCVSTGNPSVIAGQNSNGESGMAHTVDCHLADGARVLVVLGWSRRPVGPVWAGGEVSGVIAPGPRLVADPPLAGLSASRKPDPAELPNNHFGYAVQWFLFAGVALVIYVLALWKRLAVPRARG